MEAQTSTFLTKSKIQTHNRDYISDISINEEIDNTHLIFLEEALLSIRKIKLVLRTSIRLILVCNSLTESGINDNTLTLNFKKVDSVSTIIMLFVKMFNKQYAFFSDNRFLEMCAIISGRNDLITPENPIDFDRYCATVIQSSFGENGFVDAFDVHEYKRNERIFEIIEEMNKLANDLVGYSNVNANSKESLSSRLELYSEIACLRFSQVVPQLLVKKQVTNPSDGISQLYSKIVTSPGTVSPELIRPLMKKFKCLNIRELIFLLKIELKGMSESVPANDNQKLNQNQVDYVYDLVTSFFELVSINYEGTNKFIEKTVKIKMESNSFGNLADEPDELDDPIDYPESW